MSVLWEKFREKEGEEDRQPSLWTARREWLGKPVPGENAAVDEIEIGVAAHDRQRPLGYVTSVSKCGGHSEAVHGIHGLYVAVVVLVWGLLGYCRVA